MLVKADLLLGETVVLSGVESELVVTCSGGMTDWSVYFVDPGATRLAANGHSYEIRLADGRTGRCFVANLQIGSYGASVRLRGTGPLK